MEPRRPGPGLSGVPPPESRLRTVTVSASLLADTDDTVTGCYDRWTREGVLLNRMRVCSGQQRAWCDYVNGNTYRKLCGAQHNGVEVC